MAGNGVGIVRPEKAADPAVGAAIQEPAGRTLDMDLAPEDLAPEDPVVVDTAQVNQRLVNALLGFLVALDVVLSTCALVFPQTWFAIMHHQPYVDPAGLLRRTGAVWVAFTLLQGIALVRWRREPYWLALIAGVRLTELFSDCTTLVVAQHVTWFAWVTLPMASLSNLVFGWFLVSTYKRLEPRAITHP